MALVLHHTYRFSVRFLDLGLKPNDLSMRFSKVSGLGASIQPFTVEEGGQNTFTHRLPARVSYDNLVLEQGFVAGSGLDAIMQKGRQEFSFKPTSIQVNLLDEGGKPVRSWLFTNAWPVKWSVTDLDASQNQLAINTLAMAYDSYHILK